MYKLTKKKGIKKKREDKETGKEVDINVYVFKHDFGICYLYRNKTNNMTLDEKVNIENNTNIEFYDSNNENNNNIKSYEKQKEIKINLPPHKDYFLDLRSKSLLWKVNPVYTYTIEKLNNIEENENEKQNSEKSQSESKSFSNKENNDNNENNERDLYKY